MCGNIYFSYDRDTRSIKKMDEGEGVWAYEKEMLGWTFNGMNFTMQLSEEKTEAIIKLLKTTLKETTITLNAFQKVAGKLQHASNGIPGGRGLFSPIWRVFAKSTESVWLTPPIKQALQDWITIIRCVGS